MSLFCRSFLAKCMPTMSSARRLDACTKLHPLRYMSALAVRQRNVHEDTESQPLKPEIREEWNTQEWGVHSPNSNLIQDTIPHLPRLEALVKSFQNYVASLLSAEETKTNFYIITAWLVSDNVVVDLFNRCYCFILRIFLFVYLAG